MNTRSNIVALALSTFGTLALSSLGASAAIVCNGDGECWHTPQVYTYPPGVRVEVHPDNWRWREGDRFSWREHEGRGYWRGGHWETFP